MKGKKLNFNKNLKIAIIDKGWTQRGLAIHLKISEVELSRYVSGRRVCPGCVRDAISEVLGITKEELFRSETSV